MVKTTRKLHGVRARNPYQKLLTKEVLARLPPLYSQEHVKDPLVQIKFFTPWTYWTWYGIEYDPEQRLFFGLVKGHEVELGYFSLDELESIRGPVGLKIERDMHFTPQPLSQVREKLPNPRRNPKFLSTGYVKGKPFLFLREYSTFRDAHEEAVTWRAQQVKVEVVGPNRRGKYEFWVDPSSIPDGLRNPLSRFCCSQCGRCAPRALLAHGQFENRMSWLRHHYKNYHQSAFRQMYERR